MAARADPARRRDGNGSVLEERVESVLEHAAGLDRDEPSRAAETRGWRVLARRFVSRARRILTRAHSDGSGELSDQPGADSPRSSSKPGKPGRRAKAGDRAAAPQKKSAQRDKTTRARSAPKRPAARESAKRGLFAKVLARLGWPAGEVTARKSQSAERSAAKRKTATRAPRQSASATPKRTAEKSKSATETTSRTARRSAGAQSTWRRLVRWVLGA